MHHSIHTPVVGMWVRLCAEPSTSRTLLDHPTLLWERGASNFRFTSVKQPDLTGPNRYQLAVTDRSISR